MSFLARQWTLFSAALQFLTRLPMPGGGIDFDDPALPARASRYFPLAGHIVGLLGAAVWLGARWLWPAPVAAVLAVGTGVLLTGALHEGELAKASEAVSGGGDARSRLILLTEGRFAGFGAAIVVLVLGLRAAALSGQSPWTGAVALFAAHGLGRAAAALAMAVTPSAALAAPQPRPGAGEALFALAWGLVPFVMLWWPFTLASLSLAIGAGVVVAATTRLLLGGQTDEGMGAVEQAVETAVLLGCGIALAL